MKIWLASFDRVEQVLPGSLAGTSTIELKSEKDIAWEQHLQFRVLAGEDFSWIYLGRGSRVLETSGLPRGAVRSGQPRGSTL